MASFRDVFDFVSSYLDVCEYCRISWILRIPRKLEEVVLTFPPPPCGPRRLQLWKMLITLNSPASIKPEISIEEFERLANENASEATTLSNGQVGEIMRDVLRTFPTHKFFQVGSPGSLMLPRILRAIASYHPDVGYCQGMNFVVGVMILGRIPTELTGGVLLPSATYSQGQRSPVTEETNRDSLTGPASTTADATSPTTPTETPDAQENTSQTTLTETPDAQEEICSDRNSSDSQRKFSIDESQPPALPAPDDVNPLDSWVQSKECLQAEYDIFLFLEKLLDRQGKLAMAGLWQSKAPSMKLRVYQLDRILRWMLPKLHTHFLDIQLTPEVIVAQWFITLFSYTVPLQWTMQIWGYVFCQGWPALFRVVLSLLQILEDTILDVDLEGLSMMMKNWKNQVLSVASSHQEIMKNAHTMLLNDEVLLKLQEAYALEIISLSELAIAVPTPRHLAGETDEDDGISPVGISNNSSNANADGSVAAVAVGSNNSAAGSPRSKSSTGQTPGVPAPVISVPVGPLINPYSVGAPNARSWLYRYCEALPDYVISDIHRVRDELLLLEQQVDINKGTIQARIQQACLNQLEAQEQFDNALQEQLKWIVDVSHYSQEMEVAIFQADRLAMAAAFDPCLEMQDSEIAMLSSSPRYKTIYSSSDAVTAEQFNRYSYDDDYQSSQYVENAAQRQSLLDEASTRNQMIQNLLLVEDTSPKDEDTSVWVDRPSLSSGNSIALGSTPTRITLSKPQEITPIAAHADSDDDTPQRFATPWTIGSRNVPSARQPVSTPATTTTVNRDDVITIPDSDDESPVRLHTNVESPIVGNETCSAAEANAPDAATPFSLILTDRSIPGSAYSTHSLQAVNMSMHGVVDSDDESPEKQSMIDGGGSPINNNVNISQEYLPPELPQDYQHPHASGLSRALSGAGGMSQQPIDKTPQLDQISLSVPLSPQSDENGAMSALSKADTVEEVSYSQSPPVSSKPFFRFRLFGNKNSPEARPSSSSSPKTEASAPTLFPQLSNADNPQALPSIMKPRISGSSQGTDSDDDRCDGQVGVGDVEEASSDLKLMLATLDANDTTLVKPSNRTSSEASAGATSNEDRTSLASTSSASISTGWSMVSSASTASNITIAGSHSDTTINAPVPSKSSGFFVKGRVGYRVYQLASSIAARSTTPRAIKYEFTLDQYPWRLPAEADRPPGFNIKKWKEKRMTFLSDQSKLQQQKVIHASRELEIAKSKLADATKRLSLAKRIEEQSANLKVSSCDELHRLVEDANRARSQKLKYITDLYMI